MSRAERLKARLAALTKQGIALSPAMPITKREVFGMLGLSRKGFCQAVNAEARRRVRSAAVFALVFTPLRRRSRIRLSGRWLVCASPME